MAEAALMEVKDKIFKARSEKGTLPAYPFEITVAVLDTTPFATNPPKGLLRVSSSFAIRGRGRGPRCVSDSDYSESVIEAKSLC